jgi:hypothetical protein
MGTVSLPPVTYSALIGVVVAAMALAACGDSDSLKRSEVPASLSRALERLEKTGLDVQLRKVGPRDIPSLVVEADSSQPVLLVAGSKGQSVFDLAPNVPTGLTGVEPTLDMSVGCGWFVAFGANKDSAARILRLAGTCQGYEQRPRSDQPSTP